MAEMFHRRRTQARLFLKLTAGQHEGLGAGIVLPGALRELAEASADRVAVLLDEVDRRSSCEPPAQRASAGNGRGGAVADVDAGVDDDRAVADTSTGSQSQSAFIERGSPADTPRCRFEADAIALIGATELSSWTSTGHVSWRSHRDCS